MPDTTPEPKPEPKPTFRYYIIPSTLSTAFLAAGLIPQLLNFFHPGSIRLPARISPVCALAVVYMASFVFATSGARKQATATSTPASPFKPLVYGSIIALCLAYLTAASAEFLKTLQRCEILFTHTRSETVITLGRWGMALFFPLLAIALTLSESGAAAAAAASSLQPTPPAPDPRTSPGLPVWFASALLSHVKLSDDIIALNRQELDKERKRNAYNLGRQVLTSESEARMQKGVYERLLVG